MRIIEKNYIKKKLFQLFKALIVFYIIYSGFIYTRVFLSAKKLTSFYSSELVRIILFGSSRNEDGSTVSARISIIDTNGSETAIIERSWSGNYLCVNFYKARLCRKNFFFPVEIYGKNQMMENLHFPVTTSLSRYYDENHECHLLGGSSTKKNRQRLYNISTFANGKSRVFKIGKVDKITVDLSWCQTDTYYSISVGKDNELVLKKL